MSNRNPGTHLKLVIAKGPDYAEHFSELTGLFSQFPLSMNCSSPGLRPPSPRLGGERAGRGVPIWFMVPMHAKNERGLPTNRALVGQPSWLPILRASLPAEHLGGRDAAQTGRLEACATYPSSA